MARDAPVSYIAIARIARTRGNRGEVVADLHTDFPDRFEKLHEVWMELPDRGRLRIGLEDAWRHRGRIVLKLRGIDSIRDAERFIGAWVQVPECEVISLPEGTYFDHDLIGCSVRDFGGKDLGVVREILRIAGNSQLVVVGPGGEFLIPAAAEICKKISIDRREISVDLPEGLIDLNE